MMISLPMEVTNGRFRYIIEDGSQLALSQPDCTLSGGMTGLVQSTVEI
jgi:hypothetical protein